MMTGVYPCTSDQDNGHQSAVFQYQYLRDGLATQFLRKSMPMYDTLKKCYIDIVARYFTEMLNSNRYLYRQYKYLETSSSP